MTSNGTIPLIDQVRQALDMFTAAHVDAEGKIAAAATLKLTVGGNEADRKKQAASMPTEEYQGYVLHLADAEREKAAAVAHLERTEKALNVLRELLNHEAEQTRLRAADRQFEAMTIADTTAQRYAVMPGNYTTHAEFRSRYPTTGNGIKRATVAADDESDLPF
jgi:hypothetical protein